MKSFIRELQRQVERGFKRETFFEFASDLGMTDMEAEQKFDHLMCKGRIIRGIGDWYTFGWTVARINRISSVECDSIGNTPQRGAHCKVFDAIARPMSVFQ